MDFSNISGGVQVKIYTSKPYGDSVSVNKKNDSEYVILMPETSNSMTANPILNPVVGVVRGVSVKTQQYDGNVKGYTKITISTLKPIEIVTQLKNINVTNQLSEDDYSELLAQTKKTQPSVPKKVVTKPTVAKKEASKPAQKSAEIKTPQVKLDLKRESRLGLPTQQQKNERVLPASKEIKKKQIISSKKIEKPIIKEVKKPVENLKPTQETKPVVTTNVPSQSQVAQPTQNALLAPEQQSQSQPQTPIQPLVQAPVQTAKPLTFGQKIINVTENPQRLAKYKDMLLSNIYVILGGALVVFLILLLGARKMTKSMRKEKEVFAKNLDEKPVSTTNFMDKINENMTWQEKYQTYTETANQPTEQDISAQTDTSFEESFEADSELNDLFAAEEQQHAFTQETSDDNKVVNNKNEQYEIFEDDFLDENEIPRNEISQSGEIFGKDKLDELFGVDEDILSEEKSFINEEKSFISEDFSFEEAYEEAEISSNIAYSGEEPNDYEYEDYDESADEEIKSEYVIDATKGFYLVDYQDKTSLVGHIGEEVFVLKQFGEKIEGALQARLDEHKGASANYMTKVGKFKALVEVKPDDMNLLIEL